MLLEESKERIQSIVQGFCGPSLEVASIISSHILLARTQACGFD